MHRPKRPQMNAFSVYMNAFLEDYRKKNGRPYPGGFSGALTDEALKKGWESLTKEEKDEWKEKAKDEKIRARNAYVADVTKAMPPAVSAPADNETAQSFGSQQPVSDQENFTAGFSSERVSSEENSQSARQQAGSRASSVGSKGSQNQAAYASGRPIAQETNAGIGTSSQEIHGLNYRPDTGVGFGSLPQEAPQVAAAQAVEAPRRSQNVSSAGSVISNTPLSGATASVDNEVRGLEAGGYDDGDNGDLADAIGGVAEIVVGDKESVVPIYTTQVTADEVQYEDNGQGFGNQAMTYAGIQHGANGQGYKEAILGDNLSTGTAIFVPPPPPPPPPVAQQRATQFDTATTTNGLIGNIGWTQEFREAYIAQLQMPFGSRGIGRGLQFLPQMTALEDVVRSYLSN